MVFIDVIEPEKTTYIAFLARNKKIFNAKDHWKVQRFEIVRL